MTSAFEIQNAVAGFVAGEDRLKHVNGNGRDADSTDGGPVKTWTGIRRDAQIHIDAADDAGSLTEAYRRALADLETAADPDIGRLKTFMAKVDRSFAQSFQAISSRVGDGTLWYASENHFRWTYGISAGSDVPVGSPIARVASFFELSSGITKVRLTAWSRPTTAAQARSYPSTGHGDTQLFAAEKTIAELDIQATPGSLQRVSFPVDEIAVEDGKTYLFQWEFQNDAGANQAVGIARRQRAPGLSQQQRGWYDNHQPLSPPLALTWEIDELVYSVPGGTKKVIADTRDIIADAAAAAAGLAVTLNGVFRRLGADIAFSGSLTLDAPVGGTVADEVHTITEAFAPHRVFAGPGVLTHSNLSNVVVKDAGTNATLVAGTDYLLDAASGGVCLPAGQSDRIVKVSYTWSERRYDMLCIHAETMRLVVVRGTGRERDAGEFLPRPDDSALMPLFYARVATGFDTVLVPLWYLDGPVHRDLLQIRAADFEQARAALRKTLAKAHAGQPIVVAAMGDSILALQNDIVLALQSDIVSTASPNGPQRDRTDFFLENIGADKVAQLTLYDNGDGAGQVHTRASKAWAAALALAQWGSTVTYNNFASARTLSGSGTGNGADPLLRAAVWATKPDVLFIHYGMNEIGSDAIEANLRSLIERAFAHGIEVLVFGCPRPSSADCRWTFPKLRKTWRATRRAATWYSTAYRMRAAYYDPARLVEEDYVGAMGLAPIDFCSANGWNHPGIHEHDVDCAEIQAMLCG